MKTKFFRFMILLMKTTHNGTKRVYQFAPIQDFNFSWSDDILYKKYKLTNTEIDFIDKMIKPMN